MSYYDEETGKALDLIPEELAIRRGMTYHKDWRGKICYAEDEAPLLIDRLYNHEVISAEHHFYAVQVLTMRKLFLSPVGVKVGMLQVRRGEDEPAADKPVPMQDTDYLRVLRGIRHPGYRRAVQEVCDEAADPELYQAYGLQRHTVMAALDTMCDAVRALWELRSACVDGGCSACDGSCTARSQP